MQKLTMQRKLRNIFTIKCISIPKWFPNVGSLNPAVYIKCLMGFIHKPWRQEGKKADKRGQNQEKYRNAFHEAGDTEITKFDTEPVVRFERLWGKFSIDNFHYITCDIIPKHRNLQHIWYQPHECKRYISIPHLGLRIKIQKYWISTFRIWSTCIVTIMNVHKYNLILILYTPRVLPYSQMYSCMTILVKHVDIHIQQHRSKKNILELGTQPKQFTWCHIQSRSREWEC